MNDKVKCKYCNKIYSKHGIGTHIWRCHTEVGKAHKPDNVGNPNSWKRRGKTLEDLYGVEKAKSIKEKLSNNHNSDGRGATLEREQLRRQNISDAMKKIKSKPDANIKGGRCKWFEYKGAQLQGTWELRFAKLCDKKNIEWKKNQKYIYEYNTSDEQKHYYRPDFYLPEIDVWIEIKGYWWGKDKEKMQFVFEQNPNHKLKIIKKKQLQDLELLIENNIQKENILQYIKEKSFKL